MEVDAEVMQTYPCFHCIEKDKRIAELDTENKRLKNRGTITSPMDGLFEENERLKERIAELEGLVSDLECDVHFWKSRAEKLARITRQALHHLEPEVDMWRKHVVELEATNAKNLWAADETERALQDRIAELEAEVTSLNSCVQVRRKQVVKLKAKLDAVEEEVRNIDETFSHPDTTSHEAYRNIRSIVQGLRKTLGEAK